MSAYLILLRHGQSLYNKKNLFTGFIDISLSKQGIKEALQAKKILKNYKFDYVFSSCLKRANQTADLVYPYGDLIKNKALNERDYGDLSGKNKSDMIAKYGKKQVALWRRSFYERPPNGESLHDTYQRVISYFEVYILPHLRNNKNVLVVAHGNSLRSLVKFIEGLSDEQIIDVEIPTASMVVYNYQENFKTIRKQI